MKLGSTRNTYYKNDKRKEIKSIDTIGANTVVWTTLLEK